MTDRDRELGDAESTPTADRANGEDAELPSDVVETAERLTRLARRGEDERAVARRERRDELLAEHGFEARVREGSDGDVLVCYPAEWIEDGEVRIDRIDDRSRAVERPLAGSEADWEAVDRENRGIVARVGEEYGSVHEANVRAFADFMGNHHATRIADATEAHVEEFRTEYYPRNAWPSPEQRRAIETSLRIAFEVAGVERPPVS